MRAQKSRGVSRGTPRTKKQPQRARYTVEPLVRVKPWEFKGRRMERNAPTGRRCDDTCTHRMPAQGTKVCLCTVCHELFSTPNNFTKHRKDGWCENPAMLGMKLNEYGTWVGEVLPGKDLGFREGDDDE